MIRFLFRNNRPSKIIITMIILADLNKWNNERIEKEKKEKKTLSNAYKYCFK
jgi:hypothetical protein